MIAGQVMATGPDAKKAGDGARRLYRIIKSHEVHLQSFSACISYIWQMEVASRPIFSQIQVSGNVSTIGNINDVY